MVFFAAGLLTALDSLAAPLMTGVSADPFGADGFSIWDHSGNINVYPENSLDAYRAGAANGALVIDADLRLLKDGRLAVIHDATVDRTTTATGPVSAFDSADWRGLRLKVAREFREAFPNIAPPLAEDVVREFANCKHLSLELKDDDPAAAHALLLLLEKYRVNRQMVLVSSFWSRVLRPVAAQGYLVCLNLVSHTNAPSTEELKAAGISWVSVPKTADPMWLKATRAGGLRVAIYTINRFWQLNEVRSHCDAIYSDDAIYLRGTHRATRSPFRLKAPFNGQLEDNYYGNNNGRGEFYGTDEWGFDVHEADTWVGTLQGWCSPIGGNLGVDRLALNFRVRFKEAFTSRSYAWVSITSDDRKIENEPAIPNQIQGLFFVIRMNGEMAIYRSDRTGAPWKALGTLQTNPFKPGDEVPIKIYVLPTTLMMFRTDTNQYVRGSAPLARGAFLHAGVKGLHGTFRDVAVDTNPRLD